MTSCDLPSFQPAADWIELHNEGNEDINLSRWMVGADYTSNPLMGRQFIDASMLWESTSNSTILAPMGRVVVELQYDIFGPDLDDVSSMNLMNPDGELVLSITPPASSPAQHVDPMDTTLQTTNGLNSSGQPPAHLNQTRA